MALFVQTNSAGMFAQVQLSRTTDAQSRSFERLSSGYRINSAADDAAGLGIAEKMNAQVRSFAVAERNANDGISMLQVADGAAGQIGGLMTRLRDLAVQSSNGTLNSDDRTNIDTEKTQIVSEIDRIANATKFNGTSLISGATTLTFQVGADNNSDNRISVTTTMGLTATTDLAAGIDLTSAANAQSAIDTLDTGIKNLATQREAFGAGMNRLASAVSNLQTGRTNLATSLSRIRDVDVAEEAGNMAKFQVLAQAGASVLAQANQSPQTALSLLR